MFELLAYLHECEWNDLTHRLHIAIDNVSMLIECLFSKAKVVMLVTWGSILLLHPFCIHTVYAYRRNNKETSSHLTWKIFTSINEQQMDIRYSFERVYLLQIISFLNERLTNKHCSCVIWHASINCGDYYYTLSKTWLFVFTPWCLLKSVQPLRYNA